MAVLALSTAAETLVAVRHNGEVFYRINTERRRQAEFLVPLVNDVLADAGAAFKDITRVGAVTGPGSFTGLRVGLATAQGFAMGLRVPCVGIGAFDFWRAGARYSGITAPLAVALDTLRDDVFMAAYDKLTGYERLLLDPQVMPADAAEVMLCGNEYLSLIGDAYAQLPERTFVPVTHTALASSLVEQVHTADPDSAPAVPTYLRAPDVTLAA